MNKLIKSGVLAVLATLALIQPKAEAFDLKAYFTFEKVIVASFLAGIVGLIGYSLLGNQEPVQKNGKITLAAKEDIQNFDNKKKELSTVAHEIKEALSVDEKQKKKLKKLESFFSKNPDAKFSKTKWWIKDALAKLLYVIEEEEPTAVNIKKECKKVIRLLKPVR